jgi:uncharacterized membrane protein
MFHMIGGDGQEYGPVTAEQLREWIAAGRANGETKIRAEGSTEWKPLSQLPEFSEALARGATAAGAMGQSAGASPSALGTGESLGAEAGAGATGPRPLPPGAPGTYGPSSPAFGADDPNALAAEALARPYEVNVGLILGRSWDLLKSDFWPIVGVSALMLVVLSAAGAAYVGILLNGPLLGGMFAYCLKRIRGEEASVNDVFSGFQNFVQLMLGGLVTSVLVGIGALFCLIPGLYLGIAWQLTFFLIQDRQIGFWEAMEVSRKVVTKHFWGVFLLLLMTLLLNVAGVLCCFVGIFVTLPLSFIALSYLYEDLFGNPDAVALATPNGLTPAPPLG